MHLFTAGESSVNDHLVDGTIYTSIYYLNSLGSINIMEDIKSKAMTMSIEAEASPKGLWALNYAALVVYRRSDWAVSVKGFNNYVWDFEASGNQNVYGIYQSHGALLVANSEAALQTHDTDNGWDWTRHPGTTTIKLPLADLISGSNRFSSYFPFNYSPTHKLVNSPIVFVDNLHGKSGRTLRVGYSNKV